MAMLNDYIIPQDIEKNYKQILVHLQTIADLEYNKLQMDQQMESNWAELLEIPGFKPGRSNLEKFAKLRDNFPDFMAAYDVLEAELRNAKLDLDLSREETSYFNRILHYFDVLHIWEDKEE